MASARTSPISCRRIKAVGSALAIFAFLSVASFGWAASPGAKQPAAAQSTDQRIAEYRQSLKRHPNLWAVRANLGRAYLDKARETAQPEWLAKSEEELNRSLAIQPNLGAWIGLAALANYRHRFELALTWVALVQKTDPLRSDVRAMAVEAYLELGKLDEASKQLSSEPRDFMDAATLAKWSISRREWDKAVQYFETASRLAPAKQYQAWALVRAAGVYLDSGQAAKAAPYLDRAEQLAPDDRELKIHRAEWNEAEGRLEVALGIYEGILAGQSLPLLHERAWLLAQGLGRMDVAQRHYREAEKAYQHAIDLGEIYTVEPLARLRSAKASQAPQGARQATMDPSALVR